MMMEAYCILPTLYPRHVYTLNRVPGPCHTPFPRERSFTCFASHYLSSFILSSTNMLMSAEKNTADQTLAALAQRCGGAQWAATKSIAWTWTHVPSGKQRSYTWQLHENLVHARRWW